MRYSEILEACWKGYHKEGMKTMFGKRYPNCVKNKKTNEDQISSEKVRRIQNFLNSKFDANLDVDGVLGPLTKKTIEKFMPDAKKRLAPEPNKTTRVQGLKKKLEEGSRVARKPGQPANSKKHSDLYTDENPQGTIHGLKFATVEDAKASVNRIKRSGRSHAHKIQAAVAMEQRARAAGKTSVAAVYRKYINSVKKTDETEVQEGYGRYYCSTDKKWKTRQGPKKQRSGSNKDRQIK